MRKWKNLQPWLDYFKMLHTYEEKGLLETKPADMEAYITRPALFSLSGGGTDRLAIVSGALKVLKRLRAYCGWKSQKGAGVLDVPFALHVVKETDPHDLLFTLVLVRRRVWWKLWMKADTVEVISYE